MSPGMIVLLFPIISLLIPIPLSYSQGFGGYGDYPQGGNGLPPGGSSGSVLNKIDGTDFNAQWSTYGYSGYSARFSTLVSTTSLQGTLDFIMNMQYAPPTISLSATPAQTVRENGDASVTSVVLSAPVTKLSNTIANVKFYQGVTLINTDTANPPVPNGGTATYTDSTGFSTTTSYVATVTDTLTPTPSTVSSNTITYTYVYPYYYGTSTINGMTGAQIRSNLTGLIIVNTSPVTESFSPTAAYMYFAYPSSYPVLTKILDPNGFNITASFSVVTLNITGLDGSSQSYRVYQSNLTTQSGFNVSFYQ